MHKELTPRQTEIFNLMAKGLSNKEICRLLGISSNTVRVHVAAILRALDVSNRTEAVYTYQDITANPGTVGLPSAKQLGLADRLGRPAIAVVPFRNLGERSDSTQLIAGVTEELVYRLSCWRWFPVISLATSQRYAGDEHDPQRLGQLLGAQYLIYGSLSQSTDKVRVTVNLVTAEDGKEVWANRFDVSISDLFELQDTVAAQIITTMAPELIGAEARQQQRQPQGSASAWGWVCEGLHQLTRRSKATTEGALKAFEQALVIAPDYNLAWHGKVTALEIALFEQWSTNPQQSIEQIAYAALSHHQLNPEDSLAQTDMGLRAILLGQPLEAKKHLEHAVQSNPSSTRALMLLAQTLGMTGDWDGGILHLEELLKLDSNSRYSARYRLIIGSCHVAAGRADEGIGFAEEALAQDSDATGAYLTIIAGHVAADRVNEAKIWAQRLAKDAPDFDAAHRLALMQPLTHPDHWERLRQRLATAGVAV